MAWHEEDREKPQLAKSIPTPITFELQKGSAELGMLPLVTPLCPRYSLPVLFSLLRFQTFSLHPLSLSRSPPPKGIEIEGGVNRGTAEIRIKELKPEGAAKMNDLLKASVTFMVCTLKLSPDSTFISAGL